MASRPMMPSDPDAGIPDLIRRLADDSRRLARDEVRLAKLEVQDNIRTGARGAMWLALAFGVGVVALVGLTLFVAALLGRALGHYWAGTLIVAVLELVGAFVLVKRGVGKMAEQPLTLPETRASLGETAQWVRTVREPELGNGRALADVPRATTLGDGTIPERAD